MFEKLRLLYWLINSFLKKYGRNISITTLITVAIFFIIPQAARYIPSSTPHIKIGRAGQYTANQLPPDIQSLISSGLTNITPQGTATPSLALSWQIKDKGTRYIFSLNSKRTWHDDLPFQAADINYNFPDVELKILASNIIEFKIKEPFAPFPTIVSAPIFRRTKTFSRLFKRAKSELVGTGKYQVTNVKQRGPYISSLSLESPDQKTTYKFYNSETAAILGFKLGEVDKLEHLNQISSLNAWKNSSVDKILNYDKYIAVFFNTQDPMLADKNFRQALTYAIPKDAPHKARTLGPIQPQSWAYNPQIKTYNTNLQRAQEIIAEIKDEDPEFAPTIRLDTAASHLSLAETIKSSWEEIGITTQVHVVSVPPTDFQAFLAVQQIPPDPDQYSLWHSTQASNITKLQNPKIDKLLEDGRKTLKLSERKEIYQDFQRFLLEECPAAFLYFLNTYTISRD